MLLVAQGKGKINQLGYNKKTKEYVYFHKGQEIWREKGDDKLLNYCNSVRVNNTYADEKELEKYPVWNKYSESCQEFEKQYWKQLGY